MLLPPLVIEAPINSFRISRPLCRANSIQHPELRRVKQFSTCFLAKQMVDRVRALRCSASLRQNCLSAFTVLAGLCNNNAYLCLSFISPPLIERTSTQFVLAAFHACHKKTRLMLSPPPQNDASRRSCYCASQMEKSTWYFDHNKNDISFISFASIAHQCDCCHVHGNVRVYFNTLAAVWLYAIKPEAMTDGLWWVSMLIAVNGTAKYRDIEPISERGNDDSRSLRRWKRVGYAPRFPTKYEFISMNDRRFSHLPCKHCAWTTIAQRTDAYNNNAYLDRPEETSSAVPLYFFGNKRHVPKAFKFTTPKALVAPNVLLHFLLINKQDALGLAFHPNRNWETEARFLQHAIYLRNFMMMPG